MTNAEPAAPASAGKASWLPLITIGLACLRGVFENLARMKTFPRSLVVLGLLADCTRGDPIDRLVASISETRFRTDFGRTRRWSLD